jgi:hypothetical protein
MIKTFRGLLADGEQERIRLSTNDGLTGYKINKFQLMPKKPGTADAEHVAQVFTVKRSGTIPTASPTINFDDPTLIAAALTGNSTNITQNISQSIIIDSIKFNQDIYITHTEANGANDVNYYLELESMPLSKDEATVATLKDMRGRE